MVMFMWRVTAKRCRLPILERNVTIDLLLTNSMKIVEVFVQRNISNLLNVRIEIRTVNHNKRNASQKCSRAFVLGINHWECDNDQDEAERVLRSDIQFLSDSVNSEPLEALHACNTKMSLFKKGA